MRGYPILLVNLAQERCVVVGGGAVAERKVRALLESGAQVTVISPSVTDGLENLAAKGQLEIVRRPYRPGDLEKAFLVIGATDAPTVNESVWREAHSRRLLVNVIDDPAHCNFFVPSVVRRGELTISISTGGLSPALAKMIRQRLSAEFGPAYACFLALLSDLRERIKNEIPDGERREMVWKQVVESDVLALIEAGQEEAARRQAEEIVGKIVRELKSCP